MSLSGTGLVATPNISFVAGITGTLYVYTSTSINTVTVSGTIPNLYYWLVGGGGGGGSSDTGNCGGGGSGSLVGNVLTDISGTFDVKAGAAGTATSANGTTGGTSLISLNSTDYFAYGGGGGGGGSGGNAGFNNGADGGNYNPPYGVGGASPSGGGGKPGEDSVTGYGVGAGGGADGDGQSTDAGNGAYGGGGGGYDASGNIDGGDGAGGAANGTSGLTMPFSGSGFTPIVVCSGGRGGTTVSQPTAAATPGYGNGGSDGSGTNGTDGVVIFFIPGASTSNPICFLRGSKILALNQGLREEYIPIENIRKGDLVKVFGGAYIKVHTIGKTMFKNPDNADRGPNRLFRLTPANYPELTEDLIITGCHSRLVDKLEPQQKARHLQLMKTLYKTGDKFRLMAFIDEKAEPYIAPGDHEIWHLALENENPVCNYGIYANGLLVETASIKTMTERFGLVTIE